MKRLLSTIFAVLLVLAGTTLSMGTANAEDDSANVTSALCAPGGHGGGTNSGSDPDIPDTDLEGDPENWLGGQNSVVGPAVDPADDGGIIVKIYKFLLRVVNLIR